MNAETLTITTFTPYIDDQAHIADLHLASRLKQVEDGENVFIDIMDSQHDLRAINKYYIEPGGNFWIARNTDLEMVGFIGLRYLHQGEGQLKRLTVMPDHRRRGLGTLLVRTLLDWAKNNDFTRIELTTGEGENARDIYETVGFTQIGYIPAKLDDHGDLIMELIL